MFEIKSDDNKSIQQQQQQQQGIIINTDTNNNNNTTNLNMQINEQHEKNDDQQQQQQQQHDLNSNSNNKIHTTTTRHKEFQVVIVSDDCLLKEQQQREKERQEQLEKEQQQQQQQQKQGNDDEDNNKATLEPIPIEEGYATRQMDEYFRQTIAAIQEELHKKLEKPHDDHHHHSNHHHHDLDNLNEQNKEIDNFNLISENLPSHIDQTSINNQNSVNLNKSIACVDCFLNGHCVLHNNTSNTTTAAAAAAATTTGMNTKTNIRARKLINWFIIIGSILNHVLIDGFIFNYSNLFSHVRNTFSNNNGGFSLSSTDEYNNDHNIFLIPDHNVNNFTQTLTTTARTMIIGAAAPIISTTSSMTTSAQQLADINNKSKYLYFLFTLPGSLLISIYLLFIPVSLYLSKRFGIRYVAIVGAIISTISILAASFMKLNIGLFILFYSIFNGIGNSLVYIPSVLIISEWPYRKRLFSNTLALCGTSIGICIYPLICEFLLKHFDLFDTLFILSSVQLNLLVGTILLISYKDYLGNHAKCNKHLLNGQSNGHHNINSSFHSPNSHHGKSKDHDDISTNSQSIDNFTLKQHWRRFCQTRKSNLKARKNLFHLIAEEKRKSRALSKGSLEDGFVITTSNNLLAPDDPNVVVLSRKQHANAQHTPTGSSSHKPNLLTRIANSLRSLTHHSSNQSTNDKHHSHHISNQHHHHSSSNHHNNSHHTPHHHPHHLHNQTTQLQHISQIDEQSDSEKLLVDTSANNTTSPVTATSGATGSTPSSPSPPPPPPPPVEKPVPIDLMSVFIKPTDLIEKNETQKQEQHETQKPSEINKKENLELYNFHDQEYNDSSSSSSTSSNSGSNSSHSSDDEYSPTDTPMRSHFMDAELNDEIASSFFSSAKSSRYLSYRNSLTNSVKGSLIECSVQEEEEEEEDDEENDTNAKKNHLKSHNNNNHHHNNHHGHHNHHHHHHGHHGHHGLHGHHYGSHHNYNHHRKSMQHRLTPTPNTTTIHHHNVNTNAHYNKILYYNERIRKLNTLSIIDTSSVINLPINTKTLYYNLSNSFIKIRTVKQKQNVALNNSNLKTVNFINYFKYLFDKNLFLNSLIILTNFTFSISLTGFIIPIFFLIQYLKSKEIEEDYSIYILSTIGLSSAIGRIISTVVYKSNNENSKNRMFAYNLSIVLIALLTFISTFCGSLFTFTLYAMGFGGLLGFNLCLRSVFLYDIIGLDWSDDSLFVILGIGQGLAVLIGLPVAGLILDMWNSFYHVYYFACILLMISGILTIIGSKLIEFFICTHKSFNKTYLKKRS